MFQYADQPQSIGRVLDNGIQLCLSSFKQVLPLAFVGAIIANVPNLFNPAPTGTQPPTPDQLIPFFVAALSSMVAGLVFYNAMIFRMHAAATNTETTLGVSIVVGLKKLLPVLLGTLLYMLLVMLGSVLLIVPGIILMMSLFFFSMLIVLHHQGVIGALKTSHRLVWGNWWRTMTVVMVPGVLMLVIYFALGAIFGVAAVAADSPPDATADMPIVMIVAGILINTLGVPLFYAVLLALLHDLELRKQGHDLEQRIGAG